MPAAMLRERLGFSSQSFANTSSIAEECMP